MLLKKLLVIFALLVMTSVYAHAETNVVIKGEYTRVPGVQFNFDEKQVEIIEFFSFYCGHCFEFEAYIPVIKGNFPKKTNWKYIPIYWGEGSPKPGEAYLIAKDAGKGEEMKKAIFKALFIEEKDIGKVEVLEELGLKLGLGFDFSHKLRTGEKAGEVGKAILMTKKYGIDETPTLIIAGNLKTTPSMLEHNIGNLRDNTITILKSLLNK
ncbi:thiol:disulfide interchange protein DsbA precursor [bacterium BMS3Abin09]|nr:thiol:disulfide interchange protein DsbA precursor [bacterium BMS3Abin09]GBE40470.1 thiol:disulfide interchange protein DsbA precursor [bacterium BMS3Bbin09]